MRTNTIILQQQKTITIKTQKSKCRKTEFLRLGTAMQVRVLFRKSGWRKWYRSVSKSLFEFLPYLKLIDAVKKSSFDSTLKKRLFLKIARF